MVTTLGRLGGIEARDAADRGLAQARGRGSGDGRRVVTHPLQAVSLVGGCMVDCRGGAAMWMRRVTKTTFLRT